MTIISIKAKSTWLVNCFWFSLSHEKVNVQINLYNKIILKLGYLQSHIMSLVYLQSHHVLNLLHFSWEKKSLR